MTDWYQSCAYNAGQKRRFHAAARSRLRALAVALHLPPGSYPIRANKGGIAVSGEITLHHEAIYVQVAQSMIAGDAGILIRSCEGRRDFVGGPNQSAPLSLLDDIPALAGRVRGVRSSAATGRAA